MNTICPNDILSSFVRLQLEPNLLNLKLGNKLEEERVSIWLKFNFY